MMIKIVSQQPGQTSTSPHDGKATWKVDSKAVIQP